MAKLQICNIFCVCVCVQVSMLIRDQLVERAKDFYIFLDDVSIVSVCDVAPPAVLLCWSECSMSCPPFM